MVYVIATSVSVEAGIERFTSNTKSVASVSLASPIVTTIVSLSVMVPVPDAVPLSTVVTVTVNCSSFSSIVSSVVGTVTVTPVEPAGIVTVVTSSV